MKIINWGIIGFGDHAQKVMLPAFKELKNANLLAIGTSTLKKKFLESTYPEIIAFDNYEDVLKIKEIDAIYIGLPNHLHANWTIRALESGKHVLCDKPLGVSPEEVTAIINSSMANKLKVMEGFMYRFHPQHQEVLTLLKQGKIGEIRLIEIHFHYHLNNLNNIRLKPECSGGALMDVGCYLLDCMQFLTGEVPEILSASSFIGKESNVDETTCIHVKTKNKIVGHLVCGTKLLRKNFYTIYGTHGTIHVPDAFRIPRNKQSTIEVETIESSKKIIHTPPCNQYSEEIEYFNSLIADENIDKTLIPNSLNNIRLIHQAKSLIR